MSDISLLSRLHNGAMRNVNLPTSTPVVQSVKLTDDGGTTSTHLTKTVLDGLISNSHAPGSDNQTITAGAGLTGGGSGASVTLDIGAGSGITVNANDVAVDSSVIRTSGANAFAADQSMGGFKLTNLAAPTADNDAARKKYVDDAVAAASGSQVKVSAADTTSGYLDTTLSAGDGLSKAIINPGADETLALSVNVDDSTIEIIGNDLRVKDNGITDAKIASGINAAKIADGTVSDTAFQYISGLTSDAQTQINAKVSKSGDTMSGNLAMGGFKVTGLGAPSAASDAATKGYVDNALEGLKPKAAVRAASSTNISIANGLENGDSVGGVTVATGDRVLLYGQTAPEENGIYVVVASGTASRATDFDSLSPIDEINKSIVAVQEGAQAGKIFVQYGVVATLGVDPINFTFFNSVSGLVGGDGISVSGSNIDVDHDGQGLQFTAGQLALELDGSTLSKSASGVKVASGGITDTEINASAAIAYSKLSLSGSIVNADINASAAIAYSKLSLSGSIVNADINASAAIAYSKLNLSASIVNADIASGAAIAYSKLSIADGDLTIAKTSGLQAALDAKLALAGGTMTGAINMGSQAITNLASPSAASDAATKGYVDAKSYLASSAEVAGEAFSASTLYAVRYGQNAETAGRLYKADKDATSTDNFWAVGLMMTSGALSAADAAPAVYKNGLMTATSHGFTIGKPVYLSASGALTSTAPTATNEAVVKLGMVKDANTIDICVQIIGVN